MARQVNTRFVITLGAVLGIVGIGGGAYFGWNYLHNRNPEYLKAEGEAAEKRGETSKAYALYRRAVVYAVAKRMVGAEDLCMKTADLALKLSDDQTDRESAQQLYREARGTWQQALLMNLRYLPARERILEEDYKYVSMIPSAAGWTMIQSNTDTLIDMEPTYANAYLYRATARYQLLAMGAGGGADVNDTLAKIQKDLSQAVKLAPDDGRTVSLLAGTKFIQSKQAAAQSRQKESEQLQQEGMTLLQKFLARKPNNAEASITLYQVLKEKEPEAAIKLLESAYAAAPTNLQLVNKLAAIYQSTDLTKSEKLVKDYLAAEPNSAEEYLVLAQIYEYMGKLPEAIAAAKEMLNHSKVGGGLASFTNQNSQMQSLYYISTLYMNEAEKEGPATTAGKDALVQAAAFADRYRTGGSSAGMQNLLDGRLQLLRDNISQALVSLKRADANLGGSHPLPGQENNWLLTKMYLVRIYDIQQLWGLALEQLEAVRLVMPDLPRPALERAHVLNRVGRYAEALATTTKILAIPHISGPIKEDALRTQAAALYGNGNRDEADKIIASIDSVDATLILARTQIARGKYEEALEALNRVLDKEPDNPTAVSLAIVVNVQLDHKPDALKLVNRGLEKNPNNAGFQFMKAKLSQPNADTAEAQSELIKSITDDFARSMAYVQLYQKTGDLAKQMDALQSAEKALGDKSDDAMADVVQRGFSVSLAQADAAKDPADKQRYWKVARSYVEKAQRLNIDGTNGVLLQGELLYKQGETKAAIATLEQTLADHPDFSRAHTVLGLMYASSGKPDSALDQLRQSIKEKPDDVMALKGAIRLLLQKSDPGSLAEARNNLTQAMLFAPRDPEVMSFADVLGDPASAIQVREQIYRKDPTNLENLEHLAILYVQSKQANKAIELLRPVYEKNPDDLRLADTLARLYRETQQTNEARTVYERFLSSSDPSIRFQGTLLLGELFNSLGQIDEAVSTFKTAIQMAPAGDDRGERRLADLYFDTDDMKGAEALYQKIYDKSPSKDITVLRRIVETQIRQGKYSEADDLLKNVIFKQNPNDSEGLVLAGYSKLRQGKSDDAIANFNSILAKDPTNIDALHYRAFAQYSIQGDMDQAVKDLMTVRDRNPNAINSRLLLARVYRVSHQLSQAASEYRDVIALRPDFVPARLEYAQFLIELSKVEQQLLPDNQNDIAYMIRSMKPSETLQAFLIDSSNRFPKESAWQVMAGDLLTLVGRQADAQKLYMEAFNASNGSPRAATAYLDSLLRTKSYEEIIALVTKIGTVRANTIDDFMKRAIAYGAIGKNDEAIADFNRALDSATTDLNAALAIARQMVVALPPEKAVSILQARMAANPSSQAARIALGGALQSVNRSSEAAQILMPMKQDPNVQDKALVLRVLALAEYQANDFNNASNDYQQLLKLVPDDIEALNNLSFILADELKRPKDAMPYAIRAAKVLRTGEGSIAFVNNGNVYDTLGWVELLAGQTDNALRDLLRAIQSDPSPIAYYHLGKAYQTMGKKDDAGKAVQDGLKLASGQKDPAEKQLLDLQSELRK